MAGLPPRERPDWHGRRQGRRLRTGRQRLMTEMLPRLRIALPLPGSTIEPAALFPAPPAAVWLEIGFGSGEHLAGQAAAHPAVGFIGCEAFVSGVASLLGHLDRLDLTNV
ncbi:MAG: tRNA (guanosine(46)-N7)-methyltransferase TrmB, partial [Dongiaceae bacterium]